MILEKVIIIKRLKPEKKTKVNQDEKTNKVCPISGCIINKKDIGKITMKLKKYLKYIFNFFSLLKIDARKIIVNGLTTSIGWNLGRKNRFNHLFDPLTSTPIMGTRNKKNKDIKKRNIDNLIRLFSLIEEKKTKTITARKI